MKYWPIPLVLSPTITHTAYPVVQCGPGYPLYDCSLFSRNYRCPHNRLWYRGLFLGPWELIHIMELRIVEHLSPPSHCLFVCICECTHKVMVLTSTTQQRLVGDTHTCGFASGKGNVANICSGRQRLITVWQCYTDIVVL